MSNFINNFKSINETRKKFPVKKDRDNNLINSFILGKSQAEICRELGMTRQRVSQVIKKHISAADIKLITINNRIIKNGITKLTIN